jgi:adenine deaminase
MESIRAATAIAAEAVGLKDSVGTLEVGKIADITVVQGNPLLTISDVGKVLLVSRAGRILVDRANPRSDLRPTQRPGEDAGPRTPPSPAAETATPMQPSRNRAVTRMASHETAGHEEGFGGGETLGSARRRG